MIATHNRIDDLRRSCQVISKLSPPADEVIICADGCTDNTVKMLKEEFPDFLLIENAKSIGSVGSRKRILNLAQGEYILSLDDDSYPFDVNFFEQADRLLMDHPEAGVITFPELRNDNVYATEKTTSSFPGHYLSAYPNCAALMRRNVYSNLPGFPTFFHHMYEETDYALQCYSFKKAVWFEPSLTIRHHQSSLQRNPIHRHHQNARNELWSVWLRCPFPWLIPVSIFRILRQFQYACSEGLDWAVQEPIWWWAALRGISDCIRDRQPIDWKIYYAWMKLARQNICDKEELSQFFRIDLDVSN